MGKTPVAVIGASGIGKHHAKWFHVAGCEVAAFAGTGPDSCRKTEAALKDVFPFHGKAYWDIDLLLRECRPSLVAVCTPPQLHAEHVIRCLRSGAHVLCEKPLYWDPARSTPEHLAEVQKVLKVSAETRPFAVNLQFAVSVGCYRQVFQEQNGRELGAVREFFLHWTPRPGGKERPPDWYWNDLGPHALSILLGLAPDAQLRLDSVDCRVRPDGTEARFEVATSGGTCAVEVHLTPVIAGQAVRRFGANGFVVDYTAKPDESGQFYTYLGFGGREWKFEDFMRASIERFVAASTVGGVQPFVSGERAATNLRMQLEIFDRARRTGQT